MDKNTKNALIAATTGTILLSIMQASSYSAYIDIIVQYVGYVTPIVDTILGFVGPYLQAAGTVITDYITEVLNILPFGDYTYYMLIAAAIMGVALVLAIKKPGIPEPDDEE